MGEDDPVKLQIALDDIALDAALALLEEIREYVDIVEVGTPMVMACGMEAVRRIRERFPELEVLADLKIMDAGEYEASIAFEAGAKYITVLGVTDDRTILGCVEAAKRCGGRVVADMICVGDLAGRAVALEKMGVDIIAVHVGVDQQAAGRTPLDDLAVLSKCVSRAGICAAGGITPRTLGGYLAYRPDVIIVGGGIVHAADPVAAARALREAINNKTADRSGFQRATESGE